MRLAEVIKIMLDDVAIKTTIDHEAFANRDVWDTRVINEGQYDLYIGYSTVGAVKAKTASSYFVESSRFGTCTIDAYNNAHEKLTTAASREGYINQAKILQRMNVEYLPAIALAWETYFYPYRTDRFRNWEIEPSWGLIHPETWFTLQPK